MPCFCPRLRVASYSRLNLPHLLGQVKSVVIGTLGQNHDIGGVLDQLAHQFGGGRDERVLVSPTCRSASLRPTAISPLPSSKYTTVLARPAVSNSCAPRASFAVVVGWDINISDRMIGRCILSMLVTRNYKASQDLGCFAPLFRGGGNVYALSHALSRAIYPHRSGDTD